MKKTLSLLLCFIAFCHYSFAQGRVYVGKINQSDEIEMHIRVFEKQVYGYYFHKGQKTLIPLHFRLAGRNVQLFEGDEVDGTRFFDGTFTDSTLAGNWKDMKTSTTLPYELVQVRFDTIDESIGKTSGTYTSSAPGISKDVRIVYIDNKHFYFHGSITSNTCTGYIHAVADAFSGGQASYTDDNCTQLAFTTTGNTTTIIENNCVGYHGHTCSFDGKYTLKK